MGKPGLTKEEIRDHLKKKWKKKGNCPVCGVNAWIVVEEEFSLPDVLEIDSLPLALILCENCGAVQLFSSDIIRKFL